MKTSRFPPHVVGFSSLFQLSDSLCDQALRYDRTIEQAMLSSSIASYMYPSRRTSPEIVEEELALVLLWSLWQIERDQIQAEK